jgi:Putative peptidoglycan binding domain
MSAVDVLTAHGIQRAADVVAVAAAARLELAAAATLLEKESGGGHNVWGHDPVPTGGHYVKGTEVTKPAYLAYKIDRARLGSQGVGPTQLTWRGFQDLADRRGGCWDWRVNCAVGFEILAEHVRSVGLHDGFRAYNGSGPAAQAYADDAQEKLAVWRSRLAALPPAPTPAPFAPHVVRASLRAGDTGPAVAALQRFLNATFPAYSHIDLRPQRYGPQTIAVVAEFQRRAGVSGPDADGRVVGARTWAALERFGFR